MRLHTDERVYFDIFTTVGTFSLPMDVIRPERYSRVEVGMVDGEIVSRVLTTYKPGEFLDMARDMGMTS
jgi:hypothetical protein